MRGPSFDLPLRRSGREGEFEPRSNWGVSGPRYQSMTHEERGLRISFTDVGGGLVDRSGGALEGFSIAGRKGKFFPAEAVIERCPPTLKRDLDVFGGSGAGLDLARSVKRRFDPQRVLNPGRFAGRI